jgi:hypothetical protein
MTTMKATNDYASPSARRKVGPHFSAGFLSFRGPQSASPAGRRTTRRHRPLSRWLKRLLLNGERAPSARPRRVEAAARIPLHGGKRSRQDETCNEGATGSAGCKKHQGKTARRDRPAFRQTGLSFAARACLGVLWLLGHPARQFYPQGSTRGLLGRAAMDEGFGHQSGSRDCNPDGDQKKQPSPGKLPTFGLPATAIDHGHHALPPAARLDSPPACKEGANHWHGHTPLSPCPLAAPACSVAWFMLATDDQRGVTGLHWFMNVVGSIPDSRLWGVARIAAALEIATIGSALVFRAQRARLAHGAVAALNWIIFVMAWLVAAAIPLDSIHLTEGSKAFILTVSLLAAAILPARISGLLAYIEHTRRIVQAALYLLVAALLIHQLFGVL